MRLFGLESVTKALSTSKSPSRRLSDLGASYQKDLKRKERDLKLFFRESILYSLRADSFFNRCAVLRLCQGGSVNRLTMLSFSIRFSIYKCP